MAFSSVVIFWTRECHLTLKLLNFWSRSHCISNTNSYNFNHEKQESYLQQVGKATYFIPNFSVQ